MPPCYQQINTTYLLEPTPQIFVIKRHSSHPRAPPWRSPRAPWRESSPSYQCFYRKPLLATGPGLWQRVRSQQHSTDQPATRSSSTFLSFCSMLEIRGRGARKEKPQKILQTAKVACVWSEFLVGFGLMCRPPNYAGGRNHAQSTNAGGRENVKGIL